jgi:hypothetical protein
MDTQDENQAFWTAYWKRGDVVASRLGRLRGWWRRYWESRREAVQRATADLSAFSQAASRSYQELNERMVADLEAFDAQTEVARDDRRNRHG